MADGPRITPVHLGFAAGSCCPGALRGARLARPSGSADGASQRDGPSH